MKRVFEIILAIAAILICCCSRSEEDIEKVKPDIDRFALQFKDINEIAIVTRLTDLGKDMTPRFNSAGDRIYFVRLLPSSDSTEGSFIDGQLAIEYKTGQLYLIDNLPPISEPPIIQPDSLPSIRGEKTLYGYRFENILYFVTERESTRRTRVIYGMKDDSLVQLTYGSQTAYLKGISADGKYLAFTYGNEFLSAVILDNETGLYYAVPKNSADSISNDFAARFSPDGKYLVFLRSGELYAKKIAPCGDLWLIRFKPVDDE